MKTRKYFITNSSEDSICVTGRTRIDIPGMCKDMPISLPENTARQTIARLKQRYPLLKIRDAQTEMERPVSVKAKSAENGSVADQTAAAAVPGIQPSATQESSQKQKTESKKGKAQA